jgi:hypothetical protein
MLVSNLSQPHFSIQLHLIQPLLLRSSFKIKIYLLKHNKYSIFNQIAYEYSPIH